MCEAQQTMKVERGFLTLADCLLTALAMERALLPQVFTLTFLTNDCSCDSTCTATSGKATE